MRIADEIEYICMKLEYNLVVVWPSELRVWHSGISRRYCGWTGILMLGTRVGLTIESIDRCLVMLSKGSESWTTVRCTHLIH